MTSTHAQPRAWGWWDPCGGSGPGMAKDRCGAERGDSSRDGCAGGLRDGARAGGCSEHPRQRPVRVSSSRSCRRRLLGARRSHGRSSPSPAAPRPGLPWHPRPCPVYGAIKPLRLVLCHPPRCLPPASPTPAPRIALPRSCSAPHSPKGQGSYRSWVPPRPKGPPSAARCCVHRS